MIIRFTRRFLVLAMMMAGVGTLWHRSRSIGDSLRERVPQGVPPTRISESAGRSARARDLQKILRERDAAAAKWFEGFREKSGRFWMREYENELAAARDRVEREAELALEIANRVNASAMREAKEVAGKLVNSQVAEAMRIAERQATTTEWAARRHVTGSRTFPAGAAAPRPSLRLSPRTAASSSDGERGPAP